MEGSGKKSILANRLASWRRANPLLPATVPPAPGKDDSTKLLVGTKVSFVVGNTAHFGQIDKLLTEPGDPDCVYLVSGRSRLKSATLLVTLCVQLDTFRRAFSHAPARSQSRSGVQ